MKRFFLLLLTTAALQIVAIGQNIFPSSGNVGIGTTTPQKLLHVNGFGAFGNRVSAINSTRALNLADADAVMRILRVHSSFAPAVELISRTTSDGTNVAYWDFYAEPSDKSFRIRDRVTGSNLDRITISGAGNVGIGTTAPTQRLHVVGSGSFTSELYLGGTRFLSKGPGTADYNTFIGANSGNAITRGTHNTAVGHNALSNETSGGRNTALGAQALYSNGNGYDNTAVGNNVLYNNTVGLNNTAVGSYVLYNNTTGGRNQAFGFLAMRDNTTGSYNSALGTGTLLRNSTGNSNVALGGQALQTNTIGNYNVAVGFGSLNNTVSSEYNTAIGYLAGRNWDNGYNNVFVGANTDVAGQGYYNVIVIGQGTLGTRSSQVTVGNSATNSYRAYNNWANISDGRFKENVQEGVPGLSFINKLRPVTYKLKASALNAFLNSSRINESEISRESKVALEKAFQEKEALVQTGFVAQDVEKAAKEVGYDFSGIETPAHEKDVYALRYSDFVVPLVKAVQELSEKEKELAKKTEEIDVLKEKNKELEARLDKLEALITGNRNNISVTVSSTYLEQNTPNPSRGTTIIRYHVPEGTASAKFTLTNSKGQLLKTVSITSRGAGQLNLETSSLPAGVYNYSLWIAGREADTKQLVITR